MAVVLALVLCAVPGLAATMTSAERESLYASAVSNLETYIETYGESSISLAGIGEVFSGLGRYEQSPALLSYTRILEKLENDAYDYDLMLLLQMLDKDTKFKAYLAETLKGSAIGSVEELALYAAGREHEYNQQPEAAIADYEQCMSYFDASVRYFALKSGQDKAAYERAMEWLNMGAFARAYYAFGQTNRYQDSESRQAAIADLIGYVPASETDEPIWATEFTARCTATEATLTWQNGEHVTRYSAAWRQNGETSWHITDCGLNTTVTFSGLTPDTDYEFSLQSIAGKVNLGTQYAYAATKSQDGVAISEKTFPDAGFRAYISEACDRDHDGLLSDVEINNTTELLLNNKGWADLAGIEYFTKLEILSCTGNRLTSLDVSKNTALHSFGCDGNLLTSLDVSKNTKLVELDCSDNRIARLDVSHNTALEVLVCDENRLTRLNVSNNTALYYLSCQKNRPISLDLSNNRALVYLCCSDNQLTRLNLSNNTALTSLLCDSNQLTSLDLSRNTALRFLDCSFNGLTGLDLSNNTALIRLLCGKNVLTNLNVRNCAALTELVCDNNQLTSLDVSKNPALTTLECRSNSLTKLDLTKNKKLATLSTDFSTNVIR